MTRKASKWMIMSFSDTSYCHISGFLQKISVQHMRGVSSRGCHRNQSQMHIMFLLPKANRIDCWEIARHVNGSHNLKGKQPEVEFTSCSSLGQLTQMTHFYPQRSGWRQSFQRLLNVGCLMLRLRKTLLRTKVRPNAPDPLNCSCFDLPYACLQFNGARICNKFVVTLVGFNKCWWYPNITIPAHLVPYVLSYCFFCPVGFSLL